MANYGNSYTIRSFRNWGGVYRHDERVFEGSIDRCVGYVLEQCGVTWEKECIFIADHNSAAPSLIRARKYYDPNG